MFIPKSIVDCRFLHWSSVSVMSWFNAKCLLQITLSGSEWVNLNVPSSSCRHTISLILNYRGSKYTGRGLKMFAMFLPHVITVDTSQLSQSPHTDVITEYEVIYVNLLNAIFFLCQSFQVLTYGQTANSQWPSTAGLMESQMEELTRIVQGPIETNS